MPWSRCHGYRGRIDKSEACIQCQAVPFERDSVFCGVACLARARREAPKLMSIPMDHMVAKSIIARFVNEWDDDQDVPWIRYIYAIIRTESSQKLYRRYRDAVEDWGNYQDEGLRPANEQLRWHGTSRSCSLGNMGYKRLCSDDTCSLCSIIDNSFNLDTVRGGRLGNAIYTSESPTKADFYSHNADVLSSSKALLLNKVVIGTDFVTFTDLPSLSAPPDGFDSVSAAPGVTFSHEETAVYSNDAIRPAYLVIYSNPDGF